MNFVKSTLSFVLLGFFISISTFGISYNTIADGLWTDPAVWDANGVPPLSLGDGDFVTVGDNITAMPDMLFEDEAFLIVNTSGNLTGGNLTINGAYLYNFSSVTVNDLSLDSYLQMVGPVMLAKEALVETSLGTLTVNGNFTIDDADFENSNTTIVNGNTDLSVDGKFENKPNSTCYFRGNVNTDGFFSNLTTSRIYFDGTGNQSISGLTTFANLYHCLLYTSPSPRD